MKKETRKYSLRKNGAELLLKTLTTIAEKNATSLCRGFMHEPEVPKKLKTNNL